MLARMWEDLEKSGTISHSRRRTISQTDNSWFTLLTLNSAPHFDVTSPTFAGFDGPLMNSCSTLAMLLGMVQSDMGSATTPGKRIEFARMPAPVYPGDTLRAESELIERREASGGKTEVLLHTRGYTDRHGPVLEFMRWWSPWNGEHWQAFRTGTLPQESIPAANCEAPDGPLFEDFQIGQVYDHSIRRTLLGDEGAWFSLLHMSSAPFAIDASFLPDKAGLIIEDGFVLSLVTGLSVRNTTQNALANLGWENVQFYRPVFAGDTVSARTRVVAARLSKSRPGEAIITVDTWGMNQHGEPVIGFRRNFLTQTRAARSARQQFA